VFTERSDTLKFLVKSHFRVCVMLCAVDGSLDEHEKTLGNINFFTTRRSFLAA